MKVQIEVKGLEGMLEAFNSMRHLKEVKEVVKKNTATLQKTAQTKAVFTKGYSTGATKRLIKQSIDREGLEGTVKAGTEYSGYVEKGTRKMEAQPFMEPALEEVEPIFIKELKEVVK